MVDNKGLIFHLNIRNGKKPEQLVADKISEESKKLDKLNSDSGSNDSDIKDKFTSTFLWSLIYTAGYAVLVLFTLFFIASKILRGGFYIGEAHGLAMTMLIVGSVVLLGSLVTFFVILPMHRRTGIFTVRTILSMITVGIAVSTMIMLGLSNYVLIASLVFVSMALFDTFSLLFSRGIAWDDDVRHVLIIVAAAFTTVSVVLSLICSFGFITISKGGVYTDINVLNRNARYREDENGEVMLEKVMLTAYDAMRITTAENYSVLDTVRLGGEDKAVGVIGNEAFVGVRSFSEVTLPESVSKINAGAFNKSSVSRLTVTSDVLYVEDGFVGSSIKEIALAEGAMTRITFADGASLKDDVVFIVSEGDLDALRVINPEIRDRIAPAISDDKLFVNFNITAPEGSGAISEYVGSAIVDKGEDGEATFAMPYATLVTENELYGSHWVYRHDGRTFRLFGLTVGGEKITPDAGEVSIGSSVNVYGEWQEMFTVYADYSAIGGEREFVAEFSESDTAFSVPTGVTHQNKPGYTCNEWYETEELSAKYPATLSDLSRNYVIYPKWTLDAPIITVSDYNGTYNGTNHTVSSSATHGFSGVELEYIWTLDGVRVAEGSTLYVKNVSSTGRYVLTVNASDGEGNVSTSSREVGVDIQRAPVTVTADPRTITYGDENIPLTYVVVGLFAGDSLSGALTRRNGNNAGEYPITLGNLSAGDNYNMTYVGATYTINKATYDMSGITFTGETFEYNGAAHPIYVVGTLPIGLDGIALEVSYVGSAKNAGDTLITASFSTASPNYEVPASMSATVTVTKKPLTVTAEAKTTVYGVPVAMTFLAEGLVSGDAITGSLARESGDNVGEYAILLGTVSAGNNYDITYVGATYVINKATYDMSGIRFVDTSFVYDKTAHHATVLGVLPTGLDGITVTVTYEGEVVNVSDGSVLTVATFATESGNYETPAAMTAYSSISPRALTVTANALSIIYGEENLPLTYTYEGLVAGDSIDGALERLAGDNAGEYPIARGTLDAGTNYSIVFIPATYVINKATYDMSSVELSDATYIYNGEERTIVLVGTLPTGLDGITVTVTYEGALKNFGETTVTAIFATESENYETPAPMTATLKIEKKSIQVVAQWVEITYGDSHRSLDYTVAGLVIGESDIMTGSLVRDEGEDAGVYNILIGTLTAGDNYEIDYVGATYTIKKATYDMSGITFSDMSFIYDRTAHHAVISGDLPVGLDGIGVTVSYTGEATNVSDGAVLTTATFATESENYEIPEAMTAYTTVTVRTLTVTANALSITYGDQNIPLTYITDGLVEGDGILGALVRDTGDDAGEYSILVGTLDAGANYSLIYVGATYTINKATYDMSGITFSDMSFIYDRTAHHAVISGDLPVGLDGIGVTVSYTGEATNVSDGTVLTTATFATESENYEIPEAMTAYTTVTVRTLTVTANSLSITYGEENLSLTYIHEGLVEGDVITGALARESGDNAGEYSILIGTLSAGDNYEIDYVGATYTINKATYDMSGITFTGETFEYNGAAHPIYVVGTLPVGLDGIALEVSYVGSAKNAGDTLITASFSTASPNYEVPASMSATVTVTKKPLTVTAEAKTTVYGVPVAMTFLAEGLVSGDAITGSLARESGDNVGEYAILLGTVSAGNNYDITYVGATYVINKATYDMSGITFSDMSFVYDGNAHHAVISGTLPTGLDGITVTVTYTGEATNVSDGAVLTTATFATESENYEIPESMTAYTTVTVRTLTVTANGLSITYGDENIPLTYTHEGLVAGDSIEGALERLAGDNAGEYPIARGTLDAGTNYSLIYVGATYTINKATYDMSGITFSDMSFVYDGNAHHAVISGTLPTGLDGITVTVTYTGEATNVSDGAVLTTAIFATESENYEIPDVMTAYTTVTPKTLNVTANGLSITYGEEDLPLTYIYEGLVDGDVITGAPERESGDEPGEYAILVGTLDAGTNYSISFVGATYVIEKMTALIDISGVATEYTYTGAPQTVTGAVLNHTEAELVTENGTFTTVGEGDGLTVIFSAPETDHYKAVSVSVTVSVSPLKVDAPTAAESSFEFTGEEIVYIEGSDELPYTVTNGSATEVGTYTAVIELKDRENYVWSDADFDGEMEWEITEKTVLDPLPEPEDNVDMLEPDDNEDVPEPENNVYLPESEENA